MKKLLFFILIVVMANVGIAQDLHVYKLLNKGDAAALNEKISNLNEGETLEKAYKGALMTKKADLVTTPKEKLQVFKSGSALLEDAIIEAPENVEYRLLRYIIQSNAPTFLGYNKNIQEDKIMLESSKLNAIIKDIVLDFNKANITKALSVK